MLHELSSYHWKLLLLVFIASWHCCSLVTSWVRGWVFDFVLVRYFIVGRVILGLMAMCPLSLMMITYLNYWEVITLGGVDQKSPVIPSHCIHHSRSCPSLGCNCVPPIWAGIHRIILWVPKGLIFLHQSNITTVASHILFFCNLRFTLCITFT